MKTIILAVDIIRPEEKMLWHELQRIGVKTKILNVRKEPLKLGEKSTEETIALIRPVSMYRAAYTAIALETNGIKTINKSQTILTAGDKIQTYKKLVENNLPIPQTIIALSSEAAIKTMIEQQKPLINKTPIGSWGRMVSIIKDNETAKIVAEHREMLQSPQTKIHIIQEYIDTNNKDIRCFVINNECIGCMERIAPPTEWRANMALGAKSQPINEPETEELAIKASQAIKADYASIDILKRERENNYYINEVNAVPEFKNISKTLKLDIDKELAFYIKKKLKI